jgi:hypothetical protein
MRFRVEISTRQPSDVTENIAAFPQLLQINIRKDTEIGHILPNHSIPVYPNHPPTSRNAVKQCS